MHRPTRIPHSPFPLALPFCSFSHRPFLQQPHATYPCLASMQAPARKGYKDGVCALCQEGMEGEEAQGLLVRMYCNNNRFCDECKLHHT